MNGHCVHRCEPGMERVAGQGCQAACQPHEERTEERSWCHAKPGAAGCMPHMEWYVRPTPATVDPTMAGTMPGTDHAAMGECREPCGAHQHRGDGNDGADG
jgi:hypothetical protein